MRSLARSAGFEVDGSDGDLSWSAKAANWSGPEVNPSLSATFVKTARNHLRAVLRLCIRVFPERGGMRTLACSAGFEVGRSVSDLPLSAKPQD
jgi:hypothetical protein